GKGHIRESTVKNLSIWSPLQQIKIPNSVTELLNPYNCEVRAIFDMLVADLSIKDCHATLAMTRGEKYS
ncbi:hypothetical protein, partial [Mucilaginibacter rigui]|uniref:hypothetical protein n=1 Tax=Mucilaginibacter rigui TaxID=534635 RepID=UPI001CD17E07